MASIFLFLILLLVFILNISLGFSALGIGLFLSFLIYLGIWGDLKENIILAFIFGLFFDLISNFFGFHLIFFVSLVFLLYFLGQSGKKIPHLPLLLGLTLFINLIYNSGLLGINVIFKKIEWNASQTFQLLAINSITLILLVTILYPLSFRFFEWLFTFRNRQKSIL